MSKFLVASVMHQAFGIGQVWKGQLRRMCWRLALTASLLASLAGCGGGGGSGSLKLGADGRSALPSAELNYSTRAKPGGLADGAAAAKVKAWLDAELSERGDVPEPDGALARVVAEALQRRYKGQPPPTRRERQAAAERAGFAGMLIDSASLSADGDQARTLVRSLVTRLPRNRAVTRYAVVAGRGQDVGVALGSVELELEEFPRRIEPGAELVLKGKLSSRYERASVFVTFPSRQVRELPMQGRRIDAQIVLDVAGEHRVEVMGYGSTGPVVLVNVPVQVGAPRASEEFDEPNEADPNMTVEQAEVRLLELLNAARAKAGVPAVLASSELRGVALAHSLDMQENHFFGHVSPTQGTDEARGRRANLRASKTGECVASDVTPEGAHASLLQSPAHRATLLDPAFTHVGVGVALRDEPSGKRTLLATLFFGRMPEPSQGRLSVEGVLETLQSLRKSRRLPPVRGDRALSASAQAGLRVLARESGVPLDKATARAADAADEELSKPAYRVARDRSLCFSLLDVIEPRQLEVAAAALSSNAAAVGVAVLPLETPKGPHTQIFLAVEAQPGKRLDCRSSDR